MRLCRRGPAARWSLGACLFFPFSLACKLGRRRLEEEAAWLEKYRQLWDARFDELDKVVEELKQKEKADGRKKRE